MTSEQMKELMGIGVFFAHSVAIVVVWILVVIGAVLAALIAPKKRRLAAATSVVVLILLVAFGDALVGHAVVGVLCRVDERIEVQSTVPLAAKHYESGGSPRTESMRDEATGRHRRVIGTKYEKTSIDRVVPYTFGVIVNETVYTEIATGKELGRYRHYGFPGGWLLQLTSLNPAGARCPDMKSGQLHKAIFKKVDAEE